MDYMKNVKKQLKIKDPEAVKGVRGKGKRPWRYPRKLPPYPEKYRFSETMPANIDVPKRLPRTDTDVVRCTEEMESKDEFAEKERVIGPPAGFSEQRRKNRHRREFKLEHAHAPKNIKVFGKMSLEEMLLMTGNYKKSQEAFRALIEKDLRTPLQKAKDMEPIELLKPLFAGYAVAELREIALAGEKVVEHTEQYKRKVIIPTHRPQDELPGWHAGVLALAWGFGGEYRLGNGSTREEFIPRQLTNSHNLRLIGMAAGKLHTLFVSDQGLVFSCGRGKQGQLGLGENIHEQRFLKQVLPTGILKKTNKDFSIVQVGAGVTTSYSREAGSIESIRSCKGLEWMLVQVERLIEKYPGHRSMIEFKCHLMAEKRTLERRGKGFVMAWGEGKRGQLGMGKWVDFCVQPRPIPYLREKYVVCLAVGDYHVLALAHGGILYSWGCGSDGRLGHNDFEDRWEPTLIQYFANKVVTVIAAGTAHSLAVIDTPKTWQSIYCWGRGAHGRLGNGRNHNQRLPKRVRPWPLSLSEYEAKAAALGGAHSLLLFVTRKPQSSRGYECQLWSWGYGRNGQLGNAKLEDFFTPQRVKLAKWHFVVRLAAGKSHSLAVTLQGRLFAWGKNWAGELGHGDAQLRAIPTYVETDPSFFLDISGGFMHSAAIAIKKKHFTDQERKEWLRWNSFDHENLPYLGLERTEVSLINYWRCPRRLRSKDLNTEPLYLCKDCHRMTVCRMCVSKCHQGHTVKPYQEGKMRMPCECGFSETCQLLPAVQEPPTENELKKVIRLQCLLRRLAAVHKVRMMQKQILRTRHEACEIVWRERIIQSIETLIQKQKIIRLERFERESMMQAELESHQSRYYLRLQLGLQAMQQQRRVLRQILLSTYSLELYSDLPRGLYQGIKVRVWTRTAARRAQRGIPWRHRWTNREMIHKTWDMLSYGKDVVGQVGDPDVSQIIELLHKHRNSYAFVDGRRPRRNSVAGPEQLYWRIRPARLAQQDRLNAKRRYSFCEDAVVDKHHTAADKELRFHLEAHREDILHSHNLSDRVKLSSSWVRYLSSESKLQGKKGFKLYMKFQKLVRQTHRDADLSQYYDRKKRRSSIAAPERYATSVKYWDEYDQGVKSIYATAKALNLRQRDQLVFWRHPPDYSEDKDQPSKVEFEQDQAMIIQRSIDHKVRLEPEPEDDRPKTPAKVFGFTMAGLKAKKEEEARKKAEDEGREYIPGEEDAMNKAEGPQQQQIAENEGYYDVSNQDWQVAYDEHGNLYYYNISTGESQWEPPDEWMDSASMSSMSYDQPYY